MAISSPGLGSGLDVNSIVSQLVALERRPIDALNQQEVTLQAELSGVGLLRGAVSELQTTMQGLSEETRFRSFLANSSDFEVLTATAASDAAPGVFNLDVTRLAENHRLASDAFASAATVGTAGDTVTVTVNGTSSTVEIGGKTLAEVRDAINSASDNPGVTATVLTDDAGERLILSSNDTGSTNEMTLSYSATDPFNFATLNADRDSSGSFTAADLDAVVQVEGQFTVTSSSNTLEDVIDGVTLELKDTGNSLVTISRNDGAASQAVQDFANAFNTVVDSISGLATGALASDTNTLLRVENQLRSVLTNPATGIASFSLLADIGITTGETGRLEVDSARLDEALQQDFDGVIALFTDADSGFAVRMESTASTLVDEGGVFDIRTDAINDRVSQLGDRRVQLEARVARVEARLLQQYTGLDTLLTELNTTSSFLTQQLSILQSQTISINSR